MNNKQRYHFEDFTIQTYREVLESVRHLRSADFTEGDIGQGDMLWRHDVDIDMDRAVTMAKMESEVGIRATYFILLRSEFYNLLEPRQMESVREIISLGHNIGLHFDARAYNIRSESDLEPPLASEKRFLEENLEHSIDVFSFHITTPLLLSFRKTSYSGMTNTYGGTFQDGHIPYCSDSNGIWRHDRLKDFLQEHKDGPFQVLTHPVWWRERAMSPQARIESYMEAQSQSVWNTYRTMLSNTDRTLISD